jgi:rhodanese-related sulfurtransferase
MTSSPAQVKSTAFNLVLKTMLSANVPKITVAEAATAMNTYVFLDAREEEEYAVSHLPDAQFVGYKNFDLSNVKNIPKDKPIVVYCSIGKRSEDITETLTKAGYTNVKNLYGGIFEWINQDHEVYDKQDKKTSNVHAYSRLWGKFLHKGNKVY